MRTTRRLVQLGLITADVIDAMAATSPETRVGRMTRQVRHRIARELRYASASAPGLVYRLAGRRPDPGVSDDILADRVRSTLGPLERRLDVPRVHVMVDDRIAVLHGDVADLADADAIEQAVLRVSGIEAFASHLHAGLAPGDTCPSEGRSVPHPASELLSAGARSSREAL